MPFYAIPYGGYSINSTAGTANIQAIYDYLKPYGYTKEAVAGICGNAAWESGLNPWRWQGNQVNYNAGYGLFQYTPASGYIPGCSSLPDYAPNLSVSEQTPGADPNDARCQLYVFASNYLGKWVSNCWNYRDWDPADFPTLYDLRNHILTTYGSGNSLSMTQFMTITDVPSATFAFLGCFERAATPATYETYRLPYAQQCYDILQAYDPTPSQNLFLVLKVLDNQQKRKFNNI